MKRAELILKCMKGFIMENSSWGDAQSHTIQFVVPPVRRRQTSPVAIDNMSGLNWSSCCTLGP